MCNRDIYNEEYFHFIRELCSTNTVIAYLYCLSVIVQCFFESDFGFFRVQFNPQLYSKGEKNSIPGLLAVCFLFEFSCLTINNRTIEHSQEGHAQNVYILGAL